MQCYADDVLRFSKSTEEHEVHLENVFGALKENGLKLKIEKCSFVQPTAKILGHIADKKWSAR